MINEPTIEEIHQELKKVWLAIEALQAAVKWGDSSTLNIIIPYWEGKGEE